MNILSLQQPQVLVNDVSGQSSNFVLDQLLEPVAVLLPQQAQQLGANHLHCIALHAQNE